MWGKIVTDIDGTPIILDGDHNIILEDEVIVEPTNEQRRAAGFLPLIETPMPECPKDAILSCDWIEVGDSLVQKWSILKANVNYEEYDRNLAQSFYTAVMTDTLLEE